MVNVPDAYCAETDLRIGDITPYTQPAVYVKGAAEEIDAALGHIYVTPINFSDPGDPKVRPSILTLKKMNYLLASGRAVLDIAATGENTSQHAYGMGMLKEGLAMLAQLASGEAELVGADLIPVASEEARYTGPTIFNEDPDSLVRAFYERGNQVFIPPYGTPFSQPYGLPVERVY